jgi:hypothetical protein
MNKMVDDKQCTILWHVNDLKISHVDPSVVDKVLEDINEKYGKEAPITVTRGKVHDYLGMTFDYREDGVVKVTMIDYINKMLEDLPADMAGWWCTKPSSESFVSSEYDQSQETGEGDRRYVPLKCGKTFVPMQTGETGSTDRRGIPVHSSQGT